MHRHSLEAWKRLISNGTRETRDKQVFGWFWEHPDTTDHQCRDGLGYEERNQVSPSITRLTQRGLLEEGDAVRQQGHKRRTSHVPDVQPSISQLFQLPLL